MERIDSHQHFWVYNPEQYGWITPEKGKLKRDFLPADLEPLLQASRIDGCVAVQARQCVEETEWLLQLAGRHPFIRGVVGWVDLCSPQVGEQLRRYAARPGKLVGVRHVVHDEPDDEFVLRPEFRRGIAQLEGMGLAYDLLLFPRHLEPAARLVAEFPGQQFVLDHIAKPAIGSGDMDLWIRGINKLAGFPNVACKVSGMVTEAPWGEWRPADFHPYLDAVSEAFGHGRLMTGSDWPVCTLSGEYGPVMEVVSHYISRMPPEMQAGVLGGNCARIYRLGGRG